MGDGGSVIQAILRLLQTDGGAATAGGATVAAGGWAGWRLLRRAIPFGVALYARIRKLDLAKHPKRAMILEVVRAEQGALDGSADPSAPRFAAATTRDILARTGLKKGTALHHLRTLERAGVLRSRRLGRDRTWVDAGAARADPAVMRALHAPTRQRILDLAHARPGVSQAQLARELQIARPTVHAHVKELRAAGLLQVRREGWRRGCFAAADQPSSSQRAPSEPA